MKEIIIEISDDGQVSLETKGFKGSSCVEETEFLKKVLGKETFKLLIPAYFVTEKQHLKKYLNICG